ncbi:MAG: carbohydrate ABC transporter permease [Gaiellaceae bacterium]
MSVVSRTGSVGAAAAPRVPTSRRILRRLDEKVSPYLFISPFFLIFGVFGLFPLGYTAYVSLTDRNLLGPVTHYVGLANYSALLHDSYFWNAVENTFGIWFFSTVPQLALALAIAHVLNAKLHARTFFRMAVLLPQVTSLVAVALIFTQLFAHDYGFVNYFLGAFGIHHVNWEAGRFSSWFALSVMVTWRWTGYNALIYLAAMQSIPEELYEAAAVDGARGFKQFLHVTVPMLRPTIIFTVIISTIGGLQLFTEAYLFQPTVSGGTGGSNRQYQTIVMYLYEKFLGSSQFKFGYAAAIAWCLVLLIALFGLLNYLLVSRIRSAET